MPAVDYRVSEQARVRLRRVVNDLGLPGACKALGLTETALLRALCGLGQTKAQVMLIEGEATSYEAHAP